MSLPECGSGGVGSIDRFLGGGGAGVGDATGVRQVRRVVTGQCGATARYRPLSRHRTPHRETDSDDAIAAQHIILASNFKQAKQSCAILTQQMTNRLER